MDQTSPKVLTSRRVFLLLTRAAAVRTAWIPAVWAPLSALDGGGPWQGLLVAAAVLLGVTTAAATAGAVLQMRRTLRLNQHAAAHYASADEARKVALVLSNYWRNSL